ncbi:MAG TPA: hypothetical protein VF765_38360, partial [Polyangiaceae bacterium]
MPTPPGEDELDELPPLDGDANDAPEAESEVQIEDLDDASEASLDDATGEDDPADAEELDLDESDGGWLEEPNETPDLDLGDVAITDFAEGESAAEDAEEPGAGEEDFGFGDAPERGGLDAGDEGPLDEDEELREQDLPALDADEEGDLEDAALVDEGFAADEPLGLPWAAAPWERVGAPVALVGARVVACAGSGAIVAGRNEAGEAQLVKVDLEGASQVMGASGLAPASIADLVVEGATVAAVADDGAVLVSRDAGQTFVVTPLAAAGLHAAQTAIVGGSLWIRTRAGALLFAPVAGELTREPVPGAVGALTAGASAGEAATALVVDAEGRPTALLRCARDGSLSRENLEASDVALPGLVAVRGASVAYAARRGGIARRDASGRWQEIEWLGRVTALAFVGDGTVLAATYTDTEDSTTLVHVTADGRPCVVARLGAMRDDVDSDGRVLSMAYDEAHGVVWLAG